MPKNKNAEYRFMVLDRCFSDFHHKYSIEDLLEKVNDKLYDANGSKSMIMVRQLRGDFNAIRKMLPDGIYLEAIPYDGKKCYYRYSDAKVQRRKRSKIRLLYHLSFKLLVIN